jgi:alpha-tubulin suppressor-like RCC1 family protein
MWKHNGRTITVGKAWTADNGVQNPANWHIWSASEKVAAGVVEIAEETPPDSRLYNWGQNSDGTITSTAKSLADVNEVDADGDPILDEDGNQLVTRGVKWNLKQGVKEQQGSLLSQTDWAIIRKADKGTAIPSNIQTWRDGIRTKATQMETAIDNAADIDAIVAHGS